MGLIQSDQYPYEKRRETYREEHHEEMEAEIGVL